MGRALLLSLVSWLAVAAPQIPVLYVSPLALAFVPAGPEGAAPQALRIRNTGSGTLRWAATPDAPWIRVSPRSGSGPAVLSVEIDSALLPPGRHQGRITIDAGDADDSPVSVTVVADIAAPAPARPAPPDPAAPVRQAPPPPQPSPAPRTAPAPPPGSDSSAGPLRLERQVLPPAVRNLPYAQALPIAGGTPPYAARVVEGRLPGGLVLANGSVSGAARVQGYYPFVLAVTDASTPPATIRQPLALRVIILQADTALVVDPPAFGLRLSRAGREVRARLAIGSGRQSLDWTASSSVPWIDVVPAKGVSPALVELVVPADALGPGTHAATITVTMEGAPNSPASIPVRVTVPR